MVRSDARENRERILDAARKAFAENGNTSMNQVAQSAGVGAGTLYRNFPTREALVLAVFAHEVEHLVGTAADLLGQHEPVEALRLWTTELVEAMRRKHVLGDALSPSANQAVTEQTYGPVLRGFEQLLDAGKANHTIRADADPGDILQFLSALWRAAPERSPRMLALLLDGLAPQEGADTRPE